MKSFREIAINEAAKISFKGKTKKEDEKEIMSFIKSYDFYVHYIDDYKKLQKVQANNEWIVEELKKFGVTEFTVADQTRKI